MNISDSIADALMLKQVATGSLSRADIVEVVDRVMKPIQLSVTKQLLDANALHSAPIFWPRPWVSKEAVAAE